MHIKFNITQLCIITVHSFLFNILYLFYIYNLIYSIKNVYLSKSGFTSFVKEIIILNLSALFVFAQFYFSLTD